MPKDVSVEKTLRLVEARSHPFKVKLLQLLEIFDELTTDELVEKSGKSKPTVLSHLDDLESLGEVAYREIPLPGVYNKRVYYKTQPSWSIQGQTLKQRVYEEPELARGYVNYQLSHLTQIKEIIDAMIQYQQRLNQQVDEAIDDNNPDHLLQILQDHLGQQSLGYYNKITYLQSMMKDASEEEREYLSKLQDQLTEKIIEHDVDTSDLPKQYLSIQLKLPIRRLIEQLARKEWQIDGTLWPNNPKFTDLIQAEK